VVLLLAALALVATATVVPAAEDGPVGAAPPNDDFASAALIVGLPASDLADTTLATAETGEPAGSCTTSAEATVWYRYTSSNSFNLGIDTFDSTYDTVMVVYSGSSLGTLIEVACNDDAPGVLQSSLTFRVEAGTTYYIQVGGFNGAAGTLDFDVYESTRAIIEGSVTDAATGLPIPYAKVSTYSVSWGAFTKGTVADSNGDYWVAVPGPGTYNVYVSAYAYNDEWFDNSPTWGGAADLVLGEGDYVSNIDFGLTEMGSIAGMVTDVHTGKPIAFTRVSAHSVAIGSFVAGDFTDASGNYRIRGLTPGAYKVFATGDYAHFDEWYDDAGMVSSATPVAVADGVITTGIDIDLTQRYTCDGKTLTHWGTENADTITGSTGDDVISTFAGDDVVNGGGGDDTLCLGPGHDVGNGNAGNDTILGDTGNDQLNGGPGADTVLGDAGIDTVGGGTGDDILGGGADDDIINGNDGDDKCYGFSGDDTVDGGNGHDRIWGGDGTDTLLGGTGRDIIRGDGGDDQIGGGSWPDTLFGGDGHDRIYGSGGADTAYGNAGNDRIYLSHGADTAYGGDGHDRIWGGAHNDQLNGDAGRDTLYGEEDDDILAGGGWPDTLIGHSGRDKLYGGGGSDTNYGGTGWDVCTNEPTVTGCERVLL
jgi:Ca2+-binding RTX toxin-like protein